MSKNNKRNRARKKQNRGSKRQRHSTLPSGPSSPVEFVYTDEPDMKVICKSCRTGSLIPVHAMKVHPDYDPEGFGAGCPNCGEDLALTPRVEIKPDGSTLYWIDNTVVDEYIDPTEGFSVTLEHRETGELLTVTTASTENRLWALCDDCGLPFTYKGEMAFTVAADSELDPSHLLVMGCEHCGGSGHSLLKATTHSGLTTYAYTPDFADNFVQSLAEQLSAGQMNVEQAVRALRSQGGRPLTRLAAWLEARPVTVMAAGTLLTVVATLLGPQLAPSPESEGPSEDEIVEIVDRILDHYDQRHPPSDERNPGGSEEGDVSEKRGHKDSS